MEAFRRGAAEVEQVLRGATKEMRCPVDRIGLRHLFGSALHTCVAQVRTLFGPVVRQICGAWGCGGQSAWRRRRRRRKAETTEKEETGTKTKTEEEETGTGTGTEKKKKKKADLEHGMRLAVGLVMQVANDRLSDLQPLRPGGRETRRLQIEGNTTAKGRRSCFR